MSSITRKIDDNIAEHGSLEKYMEWLDQQIKENQPDIKTQELNQEER